MCKLGCCVVGALGGISSILFVLSALEGGRRKEKKLRFWVGVGWGCPLRAFTPIINNTTLEYYLLFQATWNKCLNFPCGVFQLLEYAYVPPIAAGRERAWMARSGRRSTNNLLL